MKLILIDGGPASGKNTLGTLLVQKFQKFGNKVQLLDLDEYVENYNPLWVWENKQKEEEDQQNARKDFVKDIGRYLKQDYIVIAIGERFITKEDIVNFIDSLKITIPMYLYHLNTPFSVRKQRLVERGRHSLIDLEKDQRERDSNVKWYGYVYNNINSPMEDATTIMKLIQNNEGVLDVTYIKKYI